MPVGALEVVGLSGTEKVSMTVVTVFDVDELVLEVEEVLEVDVVVGPPGRHCLVKRIIDTKDSKLRYETNLRVPSI